MPYDGSEPKSGWSLVAPRALIQLMMLALRVFSGALEMSTFQGLSVGNTRHPPTVGPAGGVSRTATLLAVAGPSTVPIGPAASTDEANARPSNAPTASTTRGERSRCRAASSLIA